MDLQRTGFLSADMTWIEILSTDRTQFGPIIISSSLSHMKSSLEEAKSIFKD
jgi:hypothetical protein